MRERAIPDLAPLHDLKRNYRAMAISEGGGEHECHDARDCGIAGHNHYYAAYNPPYHAVVDGAIKGLFLRDPIIDALRGINARIAPFELYLLDAWRPDAVQRHFHDKWFPAWLRAHRPELTGAALEAEVRRYWAAPSEDDSSPAPHATAAAVDVTISMGGHTLYMGGMFDDLTENAHTDRFETMVEPLSMSDGEARANRRLLYWAMIEAGFANNPSEWWHYSKGDQMWACLRGEPAAMYGRCDPVAAGQDMS